MIGELPNEVAIDACVERYFEGAGRVHSLVPQRDDSRTPITAGIQDDIRLKGSVASR